MFTEGTVSDLSWPPVHDLKVDLYEHFVATEIVLLESPWEELERAVCYDVISALPATALKDVTKSLLGAYWTELLHVAQAMTPNVYGPSKPLSPLVADLVRRINSMKELGANWDGYGAEPPSALARDWSIRVLELLAPEGPYPSSVSPSAEGGVAISFLARGRVATIECLNDGSVFAVRSDRVNDPFAWEIVGDSGIRQGLLDIADFLAEQA